jgi:hypothetical protein
MAKGWWVASGPEVGRVGPKFLCREPNNMTLGKEINLIKLIIKNSKLRENFSKL